MPSSREGDEGVAVAVVGGDQASGDELANVAAGRATEGVADHDRHVDPGQLSQPFPEPPG